MVCQGKRFHLNSIYKTVIRSLGIRDFQLRIFFKKNYRFADEKQNDF